MKIIRHGKLKKEEYLFNCKTCGCVFELTLAEIIENCTPGYDLSSLLSKEETLDFLYFCPECKGVIREFYCKEV
jgi:uncharacterized Zn finger protein